MSVTARELQIEEGRLRIADALLCADAFPSASDWDFIIDNRLPGLVKPLYERYLNSCMVSELDRDACHELVETRFPDYLAVAPRSEALDAVYDDLYTYTDASVHLIRQAGLHSAAHLARVLDAGDLHLCVSLLDVYQPEYSEADVEDMETLIHLLETLPQVPQVTRYRTLLGVSDKYVCPAGHSNHPDTIFCAHCGLDARGLDSDEENIIAAYALRTRALRSLIERNAESIL